MWLTGVEGLWVPCAAVGRVASVWGRVGVDDRDGRGAGVDGDVVGAAEQCQILQRGGSAIGPMHDVVGVAVPGRSAAHDTAFVASVQGATDRLCHIAFLTPDIERLRLRP